MDDLARDPFRPLEPLCVPKTMTEAADPWCPIAPVPGDAGDPREEWLCRLVPSSRYIRSWAYRDGEGRVLCHVARFDLLNVDGSPKLDKDGRPAKKFRPITFCSGPSGRREWRQKSLPDPRPLYNLGHLVLRPDQPVLVVEGEKTADAAAGLFPEHVVTTSMGGAGSAATADWTALADRDVVIWPDNDERGAAYAAAVRERLIAAGARSVRVIALPEALPPKWDLADACPAGIEFNDLAALVGTARAVSESAVT